MRDAKSKRDPARLFLKRVGLVILGGLVFFAASGVWNVYQKERNSRELRAQAEQEYAELLARKTKLEDDIQILQTSRGMEEALREQYALAGEGEGLIIIVEDEEGDAEHATSTVKAWFLHLFDWW